MNARTTQLVLALVVSIALFGAGLATGTMLGPSRSDQAATSTPAGGTAAQQAARRAALGGQGVLGGAGQATTGRILSVNDGSITVEVRQPAAAGAGASPTVTSTIALVGADTRVLRTVEQEVKLTDLKPGDQVTIVGTTDAATGTVSANAVLVGGGALQQVFGGQRPGQGGGGRAPGASPSPTGR